MYDNTFSTKLFLDISSLEKKKKVLSAVNKMKQKHFLIKTNNIKLIFINLIYLKWEEVQV